MTGTTVLPGQAGLPTPSSTEAYWHKDPSKALYGHRTTATLPSTADVVIVGSGISGASAAHFIREEGTGNDLKIVMLEAREACWGATGRNGGHCQPAVYENPPEISMFEIRNYECIKNLVETHCIPCDWRTLSVVHAYMSQSMFDHAYDRYKSFHDMDPELADLVMVVTKESTNPSLQDLRASNAKGAFVQKHAASVWPYKFVSWILERLLTANESSAPSFNLQTNTAVTRLQKTDDRSWIVHTERGMIATKKVLLTTNAYTSFLLPEFRDLIVPVRGEMSSLTSPRTMKPGTDNPPLEYSYGFMGNGDQSGHQDDYLVQRPYGLDKTGGELMFGGGRSYAAKGGVGVSDDSSIDPPAAEYLRQQINFVLDTRSDETELKATYEWSGIMGFSRDSRPWVGAVSEDLGLGGGEGLFICAGFTGHGMPNACLSARAAVHLILGRKEEDIDLPSIYWISKPRLEKARLFETVDIADAAGTFGGDNYS